MPFDDLAPEIIQQVFSLCCPTVTFTIHEDNYYNRVRSGTAQLTLSLVCSKWREIALNTRALWGDVVVIYNREWSGAQGHTAQFQSIQNWLNRAGMTPISLGISTIGVWQKSQIAAISEDLQTLLSSFHVTNLDIKSDNAFLPVPTNNLSRIERLRLSLYEPARKTHALLQLPEMPSLKELHLCLQPGDFVDLTNIYLIPWHQLRVFTLREYHWPSQLVFNILQRCKSLVECTLYMKAKHGQVENNIVLPNLESFVLNVNAKDSADFIIRSLTVPNLRSLDIKSWLPWEEFLLSPDAIEIITQRSGFKHLTSFSLCQTEEPVDVRSLLVSMPALERVQLLGRHLMFQPGIFDDLSSGTIGPRLEEICFGIMSDEEIVLLIETVGQRHEKAKTVPDIRPFASVTSHCTRGSDFKSHKQRAKQCSEAFDASVVIVNALHYPSPVLGAPRMR